MDNLADRVVVVRAAEFEQIEQIFVNCELNSLMIEVTQTGAVCHDGYPTCFYRRLEPDNSLATMRDRWFDPADVYGEGDGIERLTRRWWARGCVESRAWRAVAPSGASAAQARAQTTGAGS